MKRRISRWLLPFPSLFAVWACGPRTTADAVGIRTREGMMISGLHSTRCVIAGSTFGQSAILPPLAARCASGPRRRCQAVEEPVEPWHYVFPPDDKAWQQWGDLGYVPPIGTYFHKQFSWKLEDGKCVFTVTIYGDLDGDDVYSTYESIETQTPNGELSFDFKIQNEE